MLKNFSITLVQCPGWGREAPPLAISLLAGNLRSKGFTVHLIDLNNELYHKVSNDKKRLWSEAESTFWSSEYFVKGIMEEHHEVIEEQITQIIETGCQVVGFTLYVSTLHFTLEIINRLKNRAPKPIVILGGPSTAEFEGGLELLNNSNVDAIVLGEGDETLPEICKVLKENGHLEKIPGLVFKKDGQIVHGGVREPVPSLDAIPFPDYSKFDLTRYEVSYRLDMFSSRSCVNRCHFCSERNYFMRFRVRSGKSLFQEVQFHLSRFPNVKVFVFTDSLINGSLKTLREFCELLLKHDAKIVWGGQCMIRKSMNPEFLSLMAKAGCNTISYGVEAGSYAVRKSMNKNLFTNGLAAQVLKDTHEAGIETGSSFMFGYPTETEEDFQMTLDFLHENSQWIDIVYPSPFFTAIMPNTYLYENPEEFGLEPNLHSQFWKTIDGKNTYPLRFERYERFCKLCLDLGIKTFYKVTEEKIDKWKLLGQYYRYKKDLEKAIECYNTDLLKHKYTSIYVKILLEHCKLEKRYTTPTLSKV